MIMEDGLTRPGAPSTRAKLPLSTAAEFPASTWVEVLRWRASQEPDRCAYRFLDVDTDQVVTLTYSDLDQKAKAVAARLQSIEATGTRALLLYPPGLDYITTLFGCLYAGVVFVPAFPPRNNRNLPRLQAIVADAGAAVALTTTAMVPLVESLPSLRLVTTDDLDVRGEAEWQPPELSGDSLAFLQYTSGSTSVPKGVMISHRNLLHNSKLLAHAFQYGPSTECVTWLPFYHDMGLIGGVFQPLYGGFTNTLMSPLAFLRSPFRWLKAISDYKASLSGGPNFAYDLCVRRITAAQRESVDLSHWRVAFTGAEPIRLETLERFVSTFASCGFRREAFFPCYGLAEATLIVSGGTKAGGPTVESVSRDELAQNRIVRGGPDVQTVVGCGMVLPGEEVLVVQPESRTVCGAGEVGEIWVSSPSVARGYWNRPEETEETFGAKLCAFAPLREKTFLRTGDLGYLSNDELFVTGRIKDLIIIRGRNLYPQDIELTVEGCHAALRPNCGAAFKIDVDAEERLVIVHEVEGRGDFDAVIEAIRQAVVEEYEVQPYAVALIKPKSIPKTSSGKIQRHACRARYLDGALAIVAGTSYGPQSEAFCLDTVSTTCGSVWVGDQPELLNFLQDRIARKLGVAVSRVDWNRPLIGLGLDSLMAVELQAEVELALGVMLPMGSFMQSSSTAELAARLFRLLLSESLALLSPSDRQNGPLSPGQKGLWFLQQLDPNSVAHNIARAVRVRSALDVEGLRRSFESLVDRHASLRTTFSALDGEPVQRIAQNVELCFVEHDATDWSESGLNEKLCEEAYRPFDLEAGPLLRVHLFRRDGAGYVLLLVAHHIIVDFWSLALMMQELGEIYSAELRGVPAALRPLSLDYVDYAHWQTERLASSEFEQHWEYWRKQLSGEWQVLGLPLDKPRPAIQTFRGASHSFRIKPEHVRLLKQIGSAQGATLYMVLLAAYQVLLRRYTDQEDVVVGSPVNVRNRSELMNVVGYFVNLVALRTNFSGDPKFSELLGDVRETVVSAFEHQEFPFAEIVERLQWARDPSRSPIFQTMFVLQKAPSSSDPGVAGLALGEAGVRLDVGGMEWESIALAQRVAQFDLTLMVTEIGDELVASLEYNTDLFDRESVERMGQHFERLIESIVSGTELRVSQLQLLSERERQLLFEWNETESEYASEQCLHELFEAQVMRSGEGVALEFGAEEVSYEELNRRANQLAHYLRGKGVGPEVLVGVQLERSLEMVVAVLGVLKAGGAYVPLDPVYPPERLRFMLEDAGVAVLLTQRELVAKLPELETKAIALDEQWEQIAEETAANPTPLTTPDNLAYVIYTSGSTGQPKGVQIQHGALLNFLSAMRERPGISARDVCLSVTSLSFDIAGLELFLPLISGARVVVASREEVIDGGLLMARMRSSGATVMQATPATWRLLLEAGWQGDQGLQVLCGGEAMPAKLAHELLRGSRELWNLYGPTETTIWSSVSKVDARSAVTIGVPIANTQLYVLDEQGQAVPIGVAGELYIAGDGLARGYLKRPELTAEKFGPNPFSRTSGARMYRTGDLVRYRREGELEFLGRVDQQVKLRGYRIELGEIEAALLSHPAISKCVVIARENAGSEKRLVGYVVRDDAKTEMDQQWQRELREHLRKRLPEYMIPSAYVRLEALPLTTNGKLDRRALPAPEATEDGSDLSLATTAVAEVLLGMWQEVLRVNGVGLGDNFFELGGHSLLATQLLARVREAFGVEVALRKLFEEPTVAGLAGHVEQLLKRGAGVAAPPLTSVRRDGPLPLSFAQQRLWFIDKLEPGNPFYNIPVVVKLSGELNVDALERTLTEVVRRHEVLRTHFAEVDGEPMQVIEPAAPVRLPVTDLNSFPEAERAEEVQRLAVIEAESAFDLSRGPLLRMQLLRLAATEHVALLTMHHIITDAWSTGVLIKEVATLYTAYIEEKSTPLSELELQYGDYAAWQRELLQTELLEEQLHYWRRQLGGELPVLQVPTDRPRPEVQSYRGSQRSFKVNDELAEAVKALSRREGVTLFMTLLAAFETLLYRYTQNTDILIGTAIAGRTHKQIEPLLGCFVNTLVLRTDLVGNPKFTKLLRRVRDVTLSAYAHQQVPFEKLVEELQPERSLNHTPLFQVAFGVQNTPQIALELPGLKLSTVAAVHDVGRFELTVWVVETSEGMQVRWSYNTDLFDESRIERMQSHYEMLLQSVIAEPDARLNSLNSLTAAERAQQTTEQDVNEEASLMTLINARRRIQVHAQSD